MANESRENVNDLKQIEESIKKNELEWAKPDLFVSLKKEIDRYEKEEMEKDKDTKSHIAHYTSVEAIYSILHENKEKSSSHLRLYDAASLNDPNEGKFLKDGFMNDYKWLGDEKLDTEAFVCSFVSGDKYIGDNLAYWQAYGKDGLGCSIQIPIEADEKRFQLVHYGEEEVEKAHRRFKDYFELADKLFNKLPDSGKESFPTEFWKTFDKNRFLYKSNDYEHEKEYRCVVVPGHEKEIKYHFKSEGPYLRRSIHEEKLRTDRVLTSGSKIFIGPRVPDKKRIRRKLEKLARQSGLFGPRFCCSSIPYRKAW